MSRSCITQLPFRSHHRRRHSFQRARLRTFAHSLAHTYDRGSHRVPETHTTTPVQPIIFPAGRYGRRRDHRSTSRWTVAIAALAAGAVAVVIGLSLFRAYGEGDYRASVTSFTDVTDNQVVVTFQVRLPEGGSAKCVVRARDATGAETGREEIVVKAGPNPGQTVASHRLATRSRPVTGEVQGCRPA